jgi:hypothetical protein
LADQLSQQLCFKIPEVNLAFGSKDFRDRPPGSAFDLFVGVDMRVP